MNRAFPWVFAACLVATLSPILAASHLPAVDAPQHLFLTHVLRSLGDPASPYHATFVAEPRLTYVTTYFFVAGLGAITGEEFALRTWLLLVIAGLPFATLALLRAFKRSEWLSLLAFPLVYTDNFYWGLVSFLSSLPLTILVLAAFVRSLEDAPDRRRWTITLAVGLVLLQLTHAAGMIFPALALPLLLVLTPSDKPRRIRTLLALTPGVLLFLAWLAIGVHQDRQFGAAGEPWKAVAPLFDRRSLVFEPIASRGRRLFELLANGFWSWADRPAAIGWLVLVVALAALAIFHLARATPRPKVDPRPAALLALAVGFYFLLPTDVLGYMYQLAPRYAQLAALLVVPVLVVPAGRAGQAFAGLAAALAVYAGANLAVLFHRFDAETASFETVVKAIPPNSKILHLVQDTGSRVATHAVYLHYAALAAHHVDGIPSFSLALDPSFPVHYRPGARPPAPASEWRTQDVSWTEHAPWYDTFLVRGDARRVLGSHAQELDRVASDGPWSVWRRR